MSLLIIYLHIGFGTPEISGEIYQKSIYLRNEGQVSILNFSIVSLTFFDCLVKVGTLFDLLLSS